MGEGPDRVKNGSPGGGDVRRVSGEIESIRGELGALVAELDRRRHEAFDLGLQARRHPVVVAVAASAAALVLGGLIALAVRSRRERRRPSTRIRETRRALARLVEHPDRVAAEPSIPNKIVTAVAVAAGTAFAKRMIDRAVKSPPRVPQARPA
ncbi:hypothetical protein [Anaeromyxobacter oryzae]|uniref:DUF3618 domain-containing protein n=1 Tax=Anaeromyxobacter oryzae TaxID=2918170 RepID=A0ABM7WYZ3_9BACT|nr:hypothetical protein [Anaeromyxobacter oryzae]BDG04705.1 hypothetical protein AMOR_37010 [Anaeromyxobacter oryzae]